MSDKEAKVWKCPGLRRIMAGLAVILAFAIASYCLLDKQPQFDGTNAVALFTIGLAAGLMIIMADFIQIIEWGSLKIRTNEYNKKARKTIKSLEVAQVISYRTIIKLLMRPGPPQRGGRSIDYRIQDLRHIAMDITEAGIEDMLRDEMLAAANSIRRELTKHLREQDILINAESSKISSVILEGEKWLVKARADGQLSGDNGRLRQVEVDIIGLRIIREIIDGFSKTESPSE